MPKIRKLKQFSEKDIENFANASDESIGNLKEEMIRTTVSFTNTEHKKLKTLAKQDGRTLQSQVRHMLKNILNKMQFDGF